MNFTKDEIGVLLDKFEQLANEDITNARRREIERELLEVTGDVLRDLIALKSELEAYWGSN